MGKKSVWERLNTELDLSGVASLFSKRGDEAGTASASDLDAQAEEILEYAVKEAERRGEPIESVLAELGFDIDDGGDGGSQQRGQRENLLRTLDWDVVEEDRAETPAKQPTSSRRDESVTLDHDSLASAVTRLEAGLEPMPESERRRRLESLEPDSPVARRLHVLGAATEGQLRRARGKDAAHPYWEALLIVGIDPAAIAAVLRCEVDVSPHDPEGDSFGELLLLQEHISFRAFREAEREAAGNDRSLIAQLLESEAMTDEEMRGAVAEYSGYTVFDGEVDDIEEDAVGALPIEWVQLFSIVPVQTTDEGIIAASAYAPAPRVVSALDEAVERPVELSIATKGQIDALRESYLRRWAATDEGRAESDEDGENRVSAAQLDSLRRAITSASAVEIVRRLFEGAIESRATDIHLEPVGDEARVRYRVDGLCLEVQRLDQALFGEIVARIKVLADLDVTERRRPQDGHIRATIHERTYDMRIATVPAKRGEKLAIRLADTGRVNIDLEELGLTVDARAIIRDVAAKPFGMVLATGPVGSGKTTTLYACLNEVDRTRYHVVSVEDPVEIELVGANQVEVNYGLGFGFVAGLRALLRQDPDVILLGEIRDEETARIAVRASMTGRMVYSTLHANESVGAITTLRNFDIPSFLIANTVQGVVAQRLLRKICEYCKVPHEPTEEQIALLGFDEPPEELPAYRGKGCSACFQTGYLGRTGVFEIFRVDRVAREMILEDAGEGALRDHAIEQGMVTLQQDGLRKIQEGITSVEEYLRVLRF